MASTWLREVLGNLYPTRVVVGRNVDEPPLGLCHYRWGKVAGAIDWTGWGTKGGGHWPGACRYEKAGLLGDLSVAEAGEIEALRPIVLDLKFAALRAYRDRLLNWTAPQPWDVFRDHVQRTLSPDHLNFLICLDARLGGADFSSGRRQPCIFPRALGGLTDVLEFALLMESELRARLFSKIREILDRADLVKPDPEGLGRAFLATPSYYAVIGKPSQRELDECINLFRTPRAPGAVDFVEARFNFATELSKCVTGESRGNGAPSAADKQGAVGRIPESGRHAIETVSATERMGEAPSGPWDPVGDAGRPEDREPESLTRLGLAKDRNVFRRNREGSWTIRFEGEECHPKDSLGLRYICLLLQSPRKAIKVTDLEALNHRRPDVGAAEYIPEDSTQGLAQERRGVNTGDVVADGASMVAIRLRGTQLSDWITEALESNQLDRAERLDRELQELQKYLASTRGRAGRKRRFTDAEEKCRKRVGEAIKCARTALASPSPELGAHLARSLKTGTLCSYEPMEAKVWNF